MVVLDSAGHWLSINESGNNSVSFYSNITLSQ